MPLNIPNKEFVTLDDESKPKPILHTPKKSYPVFRYILQGVFIVLVVASAVFLIYIIAIKQLGVGPKPAETTMAPAVDTSSVAQPSEQPVEKPLQKPAEKPVQEPVPETIKPKPTEAIKPPSEKPVARPEVTLTQGSYTVYIASYNTKSPAEEEVNRWIEAGYEAMVVESAKHFRVALGQYVTSEDAKIFVKQMWEAFENGYWIGKVP
jgi:SPOR domain